MNELKPCPFCGAPAGLIYEYETTRTIREGIKFISYSESRVKVRCMRCCVMTVQFKSKSLAIDTWNRRATDE